MVFCILSTLSGWAVSYFSVTPVAYRHVQSLMRSVQLDTGINNLSSLSPEIEEYFSKSAMPCSYDLLLSSAKTANKK